MSFFVIVADPAKPEWLLRDNKGKVRGFATKAKADRAARRATKGDTVAAPVHKTDLHKWSTANV